MNAITLMFYSPLIVGIACLLFFIVENNRTGNSMFDNLTYFLKIVFVWVVLGLILMVVGIVSWSIVTNSGNGPLAIFFVWPLGISLGVMVGTIRWRIRFFKEIVL